MNAAILFAVCIIICYAISDSSSKKNEKKYREELKANPNPPEHGLVDNSVSGGAIFVCFIVIAIFSYVMVANHMF